MSTSAISGSTSVGLTANVAPAPTTKPADLTPEEKPARSPVVVITLSQAAKDAMAQSSTGTAVASDLSKAVDDLFTTSGADIYGAAISSLRTPLPDLSARYEELVNRRSLTPAENAEAKQLGDARNAREEQAFFHFAHEANAAATPQERSRLMGQYFKAYTEYYDNLSPEEQNSDRYRGTRPAAVAQYQSWSAEAGETPDDLSGSGDPILMLFDKIKKQKFNVDDASTKAVLQSYKDGVSNLAGSQDDPGKYDAEVTEASDRFKAVQSVVDQARRGDSQAFGQLKSLAEDPSALASFLNYASTLESSSVEMEGPGPLHYVKA